MAKRPVVLYMVRDGDSGDTGFYTKKPKVVVTEKRYDVSNPGSATFEETEVSGGNLIGGACSVSSYIGFEPKVNVIYKVIITQVAPSPKTIPLKPVKVRKGSVKKTRRRA